jgi:hypothetical protein
MSKGTKRFLLVSLPVELLVDGWDWDDPDDLSNVAMWLESMIADSESDAHLHGHKPSYRVIPPGVTVYTREGFLLDHEDGKLEEFADAE